MFLREARWLEQLVTSQRFVFKSQEDEQADMIIEAVAVSDVFPAVPNEAKCV